jgi:RNA polymerase sigma-54 factor
MRLNLSQSARLDQRLIQSPQMIQAMQILQLSGLELESRIEQELVENPLLEVVDPTAPPEAEEGSQTSAELSPEDKALLDNFDIHDQLNQDYGDGIPAQPRNEDAEERRSAALQNAPDVPKSLPEALSEEIAMFDFSPREQSIAEHLIWSFDERGFLPGPLEEHALQAGLEPGAEAEELEAVIIRMRGQIHPALGAQNLRDSLLLQLDALPTKSPLQRAIVADHLEDIEANRIPKIARATGRTLEEIQAAIEALKSLDASPASEYGESCAPVILPDVIVQETEGEFVVRLEREYQPQLRISRAYREMLRRSRKGDAEEEWLKKRLEVARWFLDAIAQRQSTLERIANVIFKEQRSFLERGPSGLRALRMQEVADQVSLHISTISRAVSGKYAQTPRGIYPLRYFFVSGTTRDTGGEASQVSVQERLKSLIEKEDPKKPLSDEHLAKLLAEREDISIARRTVTKYRKMLGIASSSKRRRF